MGKYKDDGDIHIILIESIKGKQADIFMSRVEVKRRTDIEFTCAEDFPYPTMDVDCVHRFKGANPKPVGYLIFNASRSNFCKIKSTTKEHWTIRSFMDQKVNRVRSTYTCPMEFCQFYEYPKTL